MYILVTVYIPLPPLYGKFSICSSKFLSITDAQPTPRDLMMLVAAKVEDYYGLGCMLDLDFDKLEMFKNELGGKAVLINMKTLNEWIK